MYIATFQECGCVDHLRIALHVLASTEIIEGYIYILYVYASHCKVSSLF